MKSDDRNKLFIPEESKGEIKCPKCESRDFSGSQRNGVVQRTCRECGTVWGGGIHNYRPDPRRPMKPETPTGPRTILEPRVNIGGKIAYEEVEILEKHDTRPDYRRGAPTQSEDDEGEYLHE